MRKTNMTNIEQNVMRRVRTVYYLRPFVSGSTLSGVVAALSLYGIGREVWVARVVENAPREVVSLLNFALSAFANTDLVVQALSLLALGAVVYFARETSKVFASVLTPARA